jgi:ribosomal protein L11 methyltransferase
VDPPGDAGPDRRCGRRHARQRARTLTAALPGAARFRVTAPDVEVVSDRLWALGATAIGERGDELEAGFVTVADAEAAVAALGFGEVVDVGPALDAALDAWMAHARPVRVGRLHVRPSWLADDDDPPVAGERVVVLDPSRAFGDGSHPSTRACLAAVDRWARPGVSVLDVGCGTGVLAVAAGVLGASPVVAVDVDPVAVAATLANARANGVEVDAVVGSVDDVQGRFDLVLANVGAATVVAMAPRLAALGRRVVVAGLYEDRVDDVVAALDAVGLMVEDRSVLEGWACQIHQTAAASEHTVAAASRDDRDTEGAG